MNELDGESGRIYLCYFAETLHYGMGHSRRHWAGQMSKISKIPGTAFHCSFLPGLSHNTWSSQYPRRWCKWGDSVLCKAEYTRESQSIRVKCTTIEQMNALYSIIVPWRLSLRKNGPRTMRSSSQPYLHGLFYIPWPVTSISRKKGLVLILKRSLI